MPEIIPSTFLPDTFHIIQGDLALLQTTEGVCLRTAQRLLSELESNPGTWVPRECLITERECYFEWMC